MLVTILKSLGLIPGRHYEKEISSKNLRAQEVSRLTLGFPGTFNAVLQETLVPGSLCSDTDFVTVESKMGEMVFWWVLYEGRDARTDKCLRCSRYSELQGP